MAGNAPGRTPISANVSNGHRQFACAGLELEGRFHRRRETVQAARRRGAFTGSKLTWGLRGPPDRFGLGVTRPAGEGVNLPGGARTIWSAALSVTTFPSIAARTARTIWSGEAVRSCMITSSRVVFGCPDIYRLPQEDSGEGER